MPENVKKRKDWVDALRALAMILVIYGHRERKWVEYFIFTSPVKIPLFFAITGYVFNRTDVDMLTFLKKLVRTIAIPWLVLAIVPYLIETPGQGVGFLWEHVKAILIGKEFWYMPCCIVAEIIWFTILKAFKETWQVAASAAVCFVAGMVLFDHGILNRFMINRALTAQVFLLIGWLIRKYERPVMERVGKAWTLAAGAAVYCALGIVSLVRYPGEVMDVHLCKYYNHVICQLMIWLGICALFILAAKYIRKYPGWWVLIGQNTLTIYLLHSVVVKDVVKIFKSAHIPINKLSNALVTVIVTAVCLGISLLIDRFLPELMGKRRR